MNHGVSRFNWRRALVRRVATLVAGAALVSAVAATSPTTMPANHLAAVGCGTSAGDWYGGPGILSGDTYVHCWDYNNYKVTVTLQWSYYPASASSWHTSNTTYFYSNVVTSYNPYYNAYWLYHNYLEYRFVVKAEAWGALGSYYSSGNIYCAGIIT